MSNGLIKINIAGKPMQLTFGMMAVEEIGQRHQEGAGGWFKLVTDIVYGGYMNDNYLEGKASELTYRDIAAGVEDLITANSPVLADVVKCFMESKAGSALAESIKKKVAEGVPNPKANHKKKPIGTK